MGDVPQKLTDISGPAGSTIAPVGSTVAVQQKYDPTPDQEKTRGQIAITLLWVLVIVMISLLIVGGVVADDCFKSADRCQASKDTMAIVTTVMNIIFTPLIGLVGTVIGFYFGSKSAAGG